MNHSEPEAAPKTTDLERRLLAHETVLQAPIAYMARAVPRFIDHPGERFVEQMRMAQHDQDHRGIGASMPGLNGRWPERCHS